MKTIKCLSLILCLLLSVGCFSLIAVQTENAEEKVESSKTYTEVSIDNWVNLENEEYFELKSKNITLDSVKLADGSFTLSPENTISLSIPIETAGDYNIAFEYYSSEPKVTDCTLEVKTNDKALVAYIPVLWADTSSKRLTDRHGNEVSPDQEAVSAPYINCLVNYQNTNREKLDFSFKSGINEVIISNCSQKLVISRIFIIKIFERENYKKIENAKYNDRCLVIEAERYSVKSDSFIRGRNEKDPSLVPYDTYKRKINVLDEGAFDTAGQKVLWEFEVEEEGYYSITLKVLQNSNASKPVYRRIEIDGEVPFKEFEAVRFDNTGSSSYESTTVSVNGAPVSIWLEKGFHTIAMSATMGPLAEVYNEILNIMSDVNDFGMEIQKLSAGNKSENRTWDIDAYMPNAKTDLNNFSKRIQAAYEKLEEIGGAIPTYANNLEYAVDIIEKLLKEPRKIPNKSDLVSTGDNSVSKYLGVVLTTLISQPLGIDRIYIHGKDAEMPNDKVSIVTSVSDFLKSFAYSFKPEAVNGDYSTKNSKDEENVTVWINRSAQYVQTLQQLIDSDYNVKNNTDIQLSIMPSEQKLILSNASGTNPDVVLSTAYTTPFNFAIRGAAKDLTEYKDFLSFYNSQYNLQSLVPLTYGEGVYGAIETQDFFVLFYRKDILENLGLDVPDTWDDVKRMMPTLLQNSMNFAIPLSTATAYKNFGMTCPFFFQNGGNYYADDGSKTAFTEDKTISGFTEMTELFYIYGLQQSVPNFFNSFRFGEIPIGISTFSTYMQLQIAAPELSGRWDIALSPGTVSDSGAVERYQHANANACMIFDNTKKEEEAWNFLKWWLSSETQVDYAYKLRSTYGIEYQWNTANLKAFEQLFYTEQQKNTILKQWEFQKEVVMHPANYMMEREVSNIWNNRVVNNKNLIDSIDRSAIVTDREIMRKLKEFGYLDQDGNLVKDYNMKAYETLLSKLEDGSGE